MEANLNKYKETYQKYPKLDKMVKLYHIAYYDGAISGICLINDEKCYFDTIEEWSCNNSYPDIDDFIAPWFRRFLIWRLKSDQLEKVESDHEKFRRMVGNHCDYYNGKKMFDFVYNDHITKETVNQYYIEAAKEPELDLTPEENQIIGWYEK